MTPEFAAPEQVLGAPVTTATDVHSLGALLYVLLSGRSPFGSSGAPAAVVMREVLDKDPAPPSGVADRARRRELRGDLDDIVSRAMRKNPVERYASALALAEDLERHLRHEPVSARAGSRAYRLSRFLMRHRVGVTAAAGVLLAAAAGIAGVLWQASEAREQARIARTEARKATAVKDFLLGIFAANSTSHPDGARARRTTAEELLAIGGEKILTELREEPETRAELMETLARLNLDLQNYERTEALHRERIDYLARSFGADDLRLAAAHVDLGALLRQRGRYDEARNSVERGVEILERRGDRSSELRGRAEAQLGQIAYMAWYGQGSEARARYEAALAIFEKHPDSTRRVDATLGYARTLEKLGRFEDAAAANLRGIALAERIKGPRDVAVAGGNQQLARVRARQFRLEEAEEHLSKAIEIFSFAAGPESGFTVMARFDQGRLFARRGKHRDAAAALERTLALFIAQEGAENVWVQDNRAALAGSLLAIGERDRAEALIREVISVVGADAHERVAAAAALLEAKLASSRGSFDAALVALDRHDRIVTLVIGPESEPLGLSLAERAEVLLRAQRHADARRALERARPLLEREADPAHSAMSRWRLTLAGIDAAERRIDVALRAAREVVAAVESLPNREEHWELESLAHARLAEILTQAGRREEARGELARAAAVRKPHVNR
jgi:serine/threonine-protein kinase